MCNTHRWLCCHLFVCPVPVKKKVATATLTLEDVTPAEINKYFMPIAVDPRRHEIVTAVVGYNTDRHQMRACSKEERAQMAGYNRRARVVDGKEGCNWHERNGDPSTDVQDCSLRNTIEAVPFLCSETYPKLTCILWLPLCQIHIERLSRPVKEPTKSSLTCFLDGGKKYKAKTVNKWTAAPFFEDCKKIPFVIFGDGDEEQGLWFHLKATQQVRQKR
ncbi:hypothetical protein BDF20DRAFT_831233 [Mycotypha africana]|uniref:uncharacterized protein n=1 Tax=Mycotypha africana TaxID=64632 RepID=UPI002300DF87|nr:uncharacterized protein BDF20DRAFT_831233 [Mycotypha africana]KAI8991167.1 hypothetical protein BDF20DRAFT_831233 [Mycotypha africana]